MDTGGRVGIVGVGVRRCIGKRLVAGVGIVIDVMGVGIGVVMMGVGSLVVWVAAVVMALFVFLDGFACDDACGDGNDRVAEEHDDG